MSAPRDSFYSSARWYTALSTMILAAMLPIYPSHALEAAGPKLDRSVSERCQETDCSKLSRGQSKAGVSATVVTSFAVSEPASPTWSLIQGRDGNFYGTSPAGGAYDDGTIFRMTPAGQVTVLHSFDHYSTGSSPQAALLEASDGNFYGTARNGGNDDLSAGTLFRLTPSGEFSVLRYFIFNDEGFGPYPGRPIGGLVEDDDGTLYGVVGDCLLFGRSLAGARRDPYCLRDDLRRRKTGTSPGKAILRNASPAAGLVKGSDGHFYGTTTRGGESNSGTVYRFTPEEASNEFGGVIILHSFAGGNEGSSPQAALVQTNSGNFYGSTAEGGTSNLGTLYRMTPAGELTILHSFSGGSGGATPKAAMVKGNDGYLYGTAVGGGTSNFGTIYRLNGATGELTILYSFPGGVGGGKPQSALV